MQQVNTYSGGGINPAQDEAGAITQAVQLAASKSYTKGTVLGQVLGSGTAVAEVQTLAKTGTVSGGTFNIVYDGEVTASLSGTATAAQCVTALEALDSIGSGGVTATGGPVGTSDVVFTFAGQLAGQAQPLMTLISAVTGGGSIAIARTTAGKPAGGYWDSYDDSASGSFSGLATARAILRFDSRTNSKGRVFAGRTKNASDHGESSLTAIAFSAGTFNTGDGSALVLIGLDANGCTDLGRFIAGTSSVLTASTTLLRIG